MPLQYKPAINGTIIDSYVKTKTSNLTGNAVSSAGATVWGAVLEKFYTDFDTTLATSMQTWLATAKVIFPPGIPTFMIPKPIMFNMTSMAIGSGASLNSKIQSTTASLSGDRTAKAGKTVWENFCLQVGEDILKVFGKAIIQACNNCVPTIPAGFSSPPMVAALASAPPIYVGLKANNLTNLIKPYFSKAIKSLGITIDGAIKAQTASLTGKAASSSGAKVWDNVLKLLSTAITLELQTKVPLFMAQSIGAWKTALVPGAPITQSGPTPAGTSLPATIVLV